jgi:PadR family transcriptional regulator, regulatory protein PadR
MTGPTMAVLSCLLEDPGIPRYGLELGTSAGLPSGTVHPILARLEAVGWLTSAWEDTDPHTEGRPRRRYYQLTPTGVMHASAAVERAKATRSRLRQRLASPILTSGGDA